MKRFALPLWGIALYLLCAMSANAQGTLNIALQQQFSFVGCSTAANVCGTPLISGLLAFFQVGTVATRQDSFQDTALTILNPWPLTLDANGRVPMFYLASGSVHVRLTDATGVVQFDYPSMLVIGPFGGGGGGGAPVDPTTIAATGDIKFRLTTEIPQGWVKLNGLTIGDGTSGATGRANADTQALYIYLWTNCPDAVCTVSTGRGGAALTDFTSHKQMTMPDWRGSTVVGLDDMGNVPKGVIPAASITFPPGATPTTPFAKAGDNTWAILQTNLPDVQWPVFISDPGHSHGINAVGPGVAVPRIGTGLGLDLTTTSSAFTGLLGTGVGQNVFVGSGGNGDNMNVMQNSRLGTWLIKL